MGTRRQQRKPTPPRVQMSGWPMTPAIKVLMLLIGGLWLVQLVIHAVVRFDAVAYAALVTDPLGLHPDEVLRGRLWQLLTFVWLHDVSGLAHVLFNLVSLFFFGPALEGRLGSGRTVALYLCSGLASGLAVLAGHGLLVALAPSSVPPVVVGASGAVSGVVAGMCWLWRERELNLFFVRVKGWHLLVGLVVLDLLRLLMGQPVAVLAHFGGMACGIAMVSGHGPWEWQQRLRLWWVRRRLRVHNGGRDDRDLLN